ncbi:MAG: hypothetical protein E4G99_02535 [Anaerolineales bacterium]|nr:MAG: hypothetical protein E4G99_02535 [Anaerolineales bacterium]
MPEETLENAVKLILTYDPLPERREAYFRYVLGEFVPTLEQMGLTLSEAWHTAYGEYPLRMTGFLASNERAMDSVLTSEEFLALETRLQEYVFNYSRRVVSSRNTFQF